MQYRIIPVTPFEQNCSLIWCEQTRKAAVVDPGGDLERILAVAKEEGVELEKILLTHAHIDHSGLIPKLVKEGFSGKIYSTEATRDLTEILLFDSAEIQTYETDIINKNKLGINAGLYGTVPQVFGRGQVFQASLHTSKMQWRIV